MCLPKLRALPQTLQTVSTFGGLNARDSAPEGEWADERNMTSDQYPLAATRKHRRRLLQNWMHSPNLSTETYGMTGGENLVYFKTYKDGEVVTDLFRSTPDGEENLTKHSREEGDISFTPGKKTICRMGGNFYIFPDNILVEGQKRVDYHGEPFYFAYPISVAATAYQESTNRYTFRAEPLEPIERSTKPPQDTTLLWYDEDAKVVRRYSKAEDKWLEFTDTHVRLHLYCDCPYDDEYEDVALKAGDSVELVWNKGTDPKSLVLECTPESGEFEIKAQFEALYGFHTLTDVDNEDGLYEFSGLLTGDVYGTIDTTNNPTAMVSLRREPPLMDYVVECKNRLWGCRYGKNREGKPVNEIYASALGDPKSWFKYQGLSTDSYAASVGTGAQFTGAVNYDGHPIFFKSDRFYTVYISANGAHQITETVAPGVQRGSAGSLAMVGGALYYLGGDGVYRYTGNLPTKVSDALRDRHYYSGNGGAYRGKYYLEAEWDEGQPPDTLVLDTVRGIWHKESGGDALVFACADNELFFLDWHMGLNTVSGSTAELVPMADTVLEPNFDWFVESGMLGYTDGKQKRIARFTIRAQIPEGSSLKVSLCYDDSGVWEDVKEVSKGMTGSTLINIRPRRCDHFRYRISGTGDCKIYAISKYYERGSIRP